MDGRHIWSDGIVPEDKTYTYLASTWATPELDLNGETEDCYIMQDDVPEAWGDDYASIYWPDSARHIVESEE